MFLSNDNLTCIADLPGTGADRLGAAMKLERIGVHLTAREDAAVLKTRELTYSDLTTIGILADPATRFARAVQQEVEAQGIYDVKNSGIYHAGTTEKAPFSDVKIVTASLLRRTIANNAKKRKILRDDDRIFWPQSLWVRTFTYLLADRLLAVWANYNKIRTLPVADTAPLNPTLLRAVNEHLDLLEEAYGSDLALVRDTPVWVRGGDVPATVVGICHSCRNKEAAEPQE